MVKEIETAPTLQDGSGPQDPESIRALRLAGWNRYELLVPIGAGGGGQVYKARDPRLGRLVALKFLRAEDLDLTARLLREAQAQARVEHEYVCKVYEVGEANGRHFIAMQFIDGQTLGRAAESMSREERVRLVAQVADAVHAAHRLGLIHRDIKPSNVMVERGPDGSWRPYVMDFGLARETAAPGVTQTGAVMGTPQYMAPEQARGGKDIDRRADVYALGATLYEVLGGRPPFDGNTLVDVLMKVVYDEPEPLRKFAPQVPLDLETIVMKCLEKDPVRRYDTARALAEDLRRFLDGEPVMARRASTRYRLAKKLRKHRSLVVVAGAALVAAGSLGLVSYRERRDAAERARLAQQLGQEVAQMESGLRYGHLAPLHDTRSERERMRARMKDLAARMARLGAIAEGPAHYALGRGHLALREWDAARADLEAAFTAGQRSPEVRYGLGQAMGALYQTALVEAERVADKAAREQRRKEIERTLRDPALDHLRAAKSVETESPEYAEGLIALYEGHFDDALVKAREALAKNPLLYEAERLAGDAHQLQGHDEQRRGQWDAARKAYEQALAAYEEAAHVGRSDPSIFEGACATWVQVLVVASTRHEEVEEIMRRTLASCEQALAADPESELAIEREAYAYARRAEQLLGENKDPRDMLKQAVAKGEQLTRVRPDGAGGPICEGNALELLAEWLDAHGEDPMPTLDRSIARYRRAIEIIPTHGRAWDDLGMALWRKATVLNARGGEAGPVYDEAAAAERKALEHGEAQNGLVHNNLANALSDRAFWALEHGEDPTPRNDAAIAEYRRAIEINPNWASAYSNLATCYELAAAQARLSGHDPGPDWERALENDRKATELSPKQAMPWANGSDVIMKQAAWLLDRDGDAAARLDDANTWLSKARGLRPGDFGDDLRDARLATLEARQKIEHGGTPEAAFTRAETALAHVAKTNGKAEELPIAAAELLRWRAEWSGKRGRKVDDEIRRGLAHAAEAEKRHPQSADASLVRGELQLVEARYGSGSTDKAIAALEEAKHRNPALTKDADELIAKARALH
jgi:serine/threonine-protein kinase